MYNRKSITLCLLTLNEVKGCHVDIPKLPLDRFAEVYCVDGGSSDGTVEYLVRQGIPVYKQPKPSLNAAYKYAIELCKTDALCFYHPKGTIPPEDCIHFLEYLDKGYEVIIGSRVIKGGRNEEDVRWFKPRKWFVIGLGLLCATLWRREGNVLWDTLHGFRGATINAFKQMRIADVGCSVDLKMVIQSYKLHLSRIEFPVQEAPRFYGKSHFKAVPVGFKLLLFIAKEVFLPHRR